MTECEPWPAPEHQDPGVNQALIDLGALGLLVGATIDDGGNGLPQDRIGTPTLPDE
ncbi:MAG: hypothetical protein ACERLM_07585 [Acidimicrobiales bacterium]